MKKVLSTVLVIMILFSCDFGPKTETLKSRSKKEAINKKRYLGEYTPNKSTLNLCDKSYQIPNIWLEKYREDLTFYNYILEMKIHFNQELAFKVIDTTFNYGYTQSRISLSNKKVLESDFSIEFTDKNDKNCRDTIAFRKAF